MREESEEEEGGGGEEDAVSDALCTELSEEKGDVHIVQ